LKKFGKSPAKTGGVLDICPQKWHDSQRKYAVFSRKLLFFPLFWHLGTFFLNKDDNRVEKLVMADVFANAVKNGMKRRLLKALIPN